MSVSMKRSGLNVIGSGQWCGSRCSRCTSNAMYVFLGKKNCVCPPADRSEHGTTASSLESLGISVIVLNQPLVSGFEDASSIADLCSRSVSYTTDKARSNSE